MLGVTAVAPTLEQARERAYAAAAPIDWEGMQMRHDIAATVAGSPVGAGRAPGDPALRAGGHGGAVQRHGALLALARGRAAGHRGPGRRSASCRPRTPPPAGPRPPRSTTSSSPTCSSARRSRTTTSPPSSTSCRSASARRPARTSTTGSPPPTWWTPRCAPRSPGRPTSCWPTSTPSSPPSRTRALELLHVPVTGPHARHARRADDVRGQVRAVGPAGRPRPAPDAGRPRRHRRGQALGRGGHVLEHRPRRWRPGSAPRSA